MPNTLGNYNPVFFANTALQVLYESLGMASRVYRVFEEDRRGFANRGEYVQVRRPSSFTAAQAPASAGGVQDLETESVSIQLNNYQQVTFKVTDLEHAYTQERIISEHIQPAAHALAVAIDTALNAEAELFPSRYLLTSSASASAAVSDITGPRRLLFDLKCPLMDPSMNHYEVDGLQEERFLSLLDFSQYQGAGDAGSMTQRSAQLGTKFGFNVFANQNTGIYVGGDVDGTAAVSGAHSRGDVMLTIGAITTGGSGTGIAKGDTIAIAGHSQLYVAIKDGPLVAGGDVEIFPPLAVDLAGSEVVTITSPDATYSINPMFHRNAIALVMAPLPLSGDGMGARVFTASDPTTGLSLRARMWYEGLEAEQYVSLDCLYGAQILNANMGVRALGAVA